MYLFVVATVLALQILSCLCQDQRPQYHFIPAKNVIQSDELSFLSLL